MVTSYPKVASAFPEKVYSDAASLFRSPLYDDDRISLNGHTYMATNVSYINSYSVVPSKETCQDNNPWKCIPQSKEHISRELKNRLLLDGAACTSFDPSYNYLLFEFACQTQGTEQFRCMAPEACSSISPDDTFNGPITVGETTYGEVWHKIADDQKNTVYGTEISLNAVAKDERTDVQTRVAEDAVLYGKGSEYGEDELVTAYNNRNYECKKPEKCHQFYPISKIAQSQGIWEESVQLPVAPASFTFKMEEWTVGCTEKIYQMGSTTTLNFKGENKFFVCEPAEKSEKAYTIEQTLLNDIYYDKIPGCCDNSPTSPLGEARFWTELGVDPDEDSPTTFMSTIQPSLVAGPWTAGSFYYYGDLVSTAGATTLYQCTGYSHCDVDPTSLKGSKGWTVTPYSAEYVTTAEAVKHWMTYDENYPYKAGDIVTKDAGAYFNCTDTALCRANEGWESTTAAPTSYITPPDVSTYTVACATVAAQAYAENDVVCDARGIVYLCESEGCDGADLTMNTWQVLRLKGEIGERGIIDCYEWQSGWEVQVGDKVCVGEQEAVWECKDSGKCQNTAPNDPGATTTWRLVSGKPQKVNLPDVAYHHALPYSFVLNFPDKFVVVVGDYIQFDEKVYQCFTATCVTDLVAAGTAALTSGSSFVLQARTQPLFSEHYYEQTDPTDYDSLAAANWTYPCQAFQDSTSFYWKKGEKVEESDIFCDQVTGKIFRVLDPYEAAQSQNDPSNEANHNDAQFQQYWKQVNNVNQQSSYSGVAIDTELTQGKTRTVMQKDAHLNGLEQECFDWDSTTNKNFEGNFRFNKGSIACDSRRVWTCRKEQDECGNRRPIWDDGKIWEITRMKPVEYDPAEALAKQKPFKKAFPWTRGYPFLPNDVVQDPKLPQQVAWTCLHGPSCSYIEPNTTDPQSVKFAWAFDFQSQIEPIEAPDVSEKLACQNYMTKPLGQDIGEQDFWCEGGRVFKCNEQQDPNTLTRAACSKIVPSFDIDGTWKLYRALPEMTERTVEEVDGQFSEAGLTIVEGKYCKDDDIFWKNGTVWHGIIEWNYTLGVGNGEFATICTNDTKMQAQIKRTEVNTRSLPVDERKWPRNVKIFNQAIHPQVIAKLLAGKEYDDEKHREKLRQIWSFFPALCNEKGPQVTDRSLVQVCQDEIIAILVYSLTGGGKPFDWQQLVQSNPHYAKFGEVQWWQTGLKADNHQVTYCTNTYEGCDTKQNESYTGFEAWLQNDQYSYAEQNQTGILKVEGPIEFSEFSRVMFDNEYDLGWYPDQMLKYGEGSADNAFPPLVTALPIWRYMTNYHSYIPSMHEIVTGIFEPSWQEEQAGLKSRDFCTMVTAAWNSHEFKVNHTLGLAYEFRNLTNATKWDLVGDGYLGEAYKAMQIQFGEKPDEDYDYTCNTTEAWPETIPHRQRLFLQIKEHQYGYACEFSENKTIYNVLQEGDVSRCLQDTQSDNLDYETVWRRKWNKWKGKKVQKWDNHDLKNPQPWSIAPTQDNTAYMENPNCDQACKDDPNGNHYQFFQCIVRTDNAYNCTIKNPQEDFGYEWWTDVPYDRATNGTDDYHIANFQMQRSDRVRCITWETMQKTWFRYYWNVLSPYKKNMLVCKNGMAFTCDARYPTNYHNRSSEPECLKEVNGVTERRAHDNKQIWKPIDARGWLDPSFEQENPDCASNVEDVKWLFEDNSLREEYIGGNLTHQYLFLNLSHQVNWDWDVSQIEPVDATGLDPLTDRFKMSGVQKKLRINEWGSLCTNQVKFYDYSVYAYQVSLSSAIFTNRRLDTEKLIIKYGTSVYSMPQNVQNLLAGNFITKKKFDAYIRNQKDKYFLDWYGFLTAVAKVPKFCNATINGPYQQFDVQKMCRKEVAAFLAAAVATNNQFDEEKKDPSTGSAVPFTEQGFADYEETACNTTESECTGYRQQSSFFDQVSGECAFVRCHETDNFHPRGALGLQGIAQYYWYGKVAHDGYSATDFSTEYRWRMRDFQEDIKYQNIDVVVQEPWRVSEEQATFWLSGLFKWMVPFDSKPAAHNIMTGQWTPLTEEVSVGIKPGFGAVQQLLWGETVCGLSQSPKGNTATKAFRDLLSTFNAEDTVLENEGESSDCYSAHRMAFPESQFGAFPTFYTPYYVDEYGNEQGKLDNRCAFTKETTPYFAYAKDAYRKCAIADTDGEARDWQY